MSNRILVKDKEPNAFKAMMSLENYCQSTPISPILKELIKIRASQLNACAYCLDMHTEDAINKGESSRRIYLLSAWKECPLFTEEEKVALQLTEEITHISQNGVSENTYQQTIHFFGEQTTAQLIMLIVTINAWNRISIASNAVYKP